VQNVIRHKAVAHAVNRGPDLGDIDLFHRIRYVKKEIWVMRVNVLVRESTEKPGDSARKACH